MLVDTSLWVDHLRKGYPPLKVALEAGEVETHLFVLGELACGIIRNRDEILGLLSALPRVTAADHEEVLAMIDGRRLYGSRLGWVDMHLIAAAILSGTTLWTLDKRLATQARRLGVLFGS